MLRHALSELRLHPTRFVATLIAIAISVGFVAAISVFVNSQQSALGKQNALQISKADVVVAIDEYEWPEDGSDPLGAVDDVLAIVEDQQHPAGAQECGQCVRHRSVAGLPAVQRQGIAYGLGQQGFIADRGEVDEPHAVGKGAAKLLGGGDRQARLADSARAHHRHEPMVAQETA